MKRLTLILMLICSLAFVSQAWAGRYLPRVMGDEDLVVSTSGASGFASIPDNTVSAWVTVQGDAVRWKIDSTPTTTNGPVLSQGDAPLVLPSLYAIEAFKGITISTGSGSTIYVVYFGKKD